MTPEETLERLRLFGSSAYALQALYDGYERFEWNSGGDAALISYVDARGAWVAASEPLGPAEVRLAALEAFRAEAWARGRVALALPVGEELARQAEGAGWRVLQVGMEPWLDLQDAALTAPVLGKRFPAARQLLARGARVSRFDPLGLRAEEHLEMESLTRQWLDSRKMPSLAFLNRVEPWTLAGSKRYYRIRMRGEWVAYLSCVPVPARNAWYLVDLIRRPDAPAGASELLILEAIRDFREGGARACTLGLSPLAESSGVFLRALSRTGRAFYDFESLYDFKRKFEPARWEKLYLLSTRSPASPRIWVPLQRAVLGRGLVATAVLAISRRTAQWRVGEMLAPLLSPGVVPRSWPDRGHGGVEILRRLRTTLLLAVLQVWVFFSSAKPLASGWRLPPGVANRWAFSVESIAREGIQFKDLSHVLAAGFLHWDLPQLVFNLITLVFFGGLLEILGGPRLLIAAFAAGIFLSNPLTAGLWFVALRAASFLSATHLAVGAVDAVARISQLVREQDVGCSTGVFCAAGALAHFFKRTEWILAGALVLIPIVARVQGSYLALNHGVALILGWMIARNYVSTE